MCTMRSQETRSFYSALREPFGVMGEITAASNKVTFTECEFTFGMMGEKLKDILNTVENY